MNQTFDDGRLIAERFRIVRFINQGGMGEVYEALDLELDEYVALKIVRVQAGQEIESSRDAIKREVQLARKVTHPNVCRTFDVFRHSDARSDFIVITMELLRGESLAKYISRKDRLTPAEVFPLATQMARALQAAHLAGVIHRDFKSGNVILVKDATAADGLRAVVTDFGIATADTAVQSAEIGGMPLISGSPSYMSPEQAQGQPVTAASDIYSFGVVMYEMLVGQLPHRAASPMALLTQRLSSAPPSPRDAIPELDPEWNAAVLRCLALDPQDRFSDISELLGALFSTRAGQKARLGESGLYDFKRTSGKPVLWGLGIVALATLILVGLFQMRSPKISALPIPSQVTTSAGLEVDPAFSPDGTKIAFSANANGSFEIHLRDLESGEDRQLTHDGAQNFHSCWSPDGASIVFYSRRRGGIWRMDIDGDGRRQLTDFGSHPALSPDGRYLAFQSGSKVQLSANSSDALPPSTIWILPLGDEPVQVTQPGQPAGGHGGPTWSPDGDRLVFSSSSRRSSELWSIRRDGSDLVRMIEKPKITFNPHYSHDGKRLYFTAVSEGERYGVWSVPLDSSHTPASDQARNILNLGSMNIRHFALSSDGGKMVFSGMSTISNLFAVEVDPATAEPTSEPISLTSGSARNNRPTFSADGSLIAFDRWHIGVNQSIWLMQADGSGARQITPGERSDTQASFFDGGRRIAFLSNQSGGPWSLWGMPIHGGSPALLRSFAASTNWARLSTDGQRVAYHSARGGSTLNVWVTDRHGGQERQLTFDDELMGFPCWSPDGSLLALEVKRGEDTHVAIVPSSGGEVRILTDEPGESWPYSWSPDGDKIAFAGFRGNMWNIWWYSLASQKSHPITSNTRLNSYLRYPAWSPQGDRIVYEYAETTGDIWLVENLP